MFALLFLLKLSVAIAFMGLGYFCALATERGVPRELRRRVFAFVFATLATLFGDAVLFW